jgi:predicted membrane protein
MKRWQVIIGIILILFGIIALMNQVFPNLRIGRFVGPLILIGLGLLLILRPRIAGPNVIVQIPILGDVRKTGIWEVTQHEIWWLVGSSRLDFTEAVFPKGDAVIKIFGFVTDLKVILPEDVGLRVSSSAFVSEYSGLYGKQERFLSQLEDQSENYSSADKRVDLQTVAFVSEIKIRPSF